MRKSDVWAGLMDSLCWGLGLELGLLSTLSWYTSDRELWLLFSSAETAPGEEEHLDPGAQAAQGSTANWGFAKKAEHSQRVKRDSPFPISPRAGRYRTALQNTAGIVYTTGHGRGNAPALGMRTSTAKSHICSLGGLWASEGRNLLSCIRFCSSSVKQRQD